MPVRCVLVRRAQLAQLFAQALRGGFKLAALDAGQLDAALVRPDTVAAEVKEEKRVGDLGGHRRQQAVQQAERAVIQREIVDQQAEHAEAHHRAVHRRAGEDIQRLPDRGDDHRRQDDDVALRLDARGADDLHDEEHDHRGEDAVVHHAVDRLPEVGEQAEVGRAVGRDLLRAEGVAGEDVR